MIREKLKIFLKKQKESRNKFTNKVLDSEHPKKVIIAGPGTGKTYALYRLSKEKRGNYLALTFINNLVDKIKIDLGDDVKSYTFHGYCKKLLHNIDCDGINNNFIYFPKLTLIIKSDAQIIYNVKPNFDRSFKCLYQKSKNIPFYLKRGNYYNAVSFDDSVYRVLMYFRNNLDKLPTYEQIFVDEFQDFNKLEVEFINIMALKSPILIVGDDDQALYTRRYSSSKYIREKFNDPSFEKFELPYSSRCTKVITSAINDVVSKARSLNNLKDRINKKFICYLPEKLNDSRIYPKIIHVKCSVQKKNVPYISRYIEKEIDLLKTEEIKSANKKGDYTILIIGPKHYLEMINTYLVNKNKYKVFYEERKRKSDKLSLLEGYKILLNEGILTNLGWRVIIEIDSLNNNEKIIKKTLNKNNNLYDLLSNEYKDKHIKVLELLRELIKGKVSSQNIKFLEEQLGLEIENIKEKLELEPIEKNHERKELLLEEDEIYIKLTTYEGSKGLSAGFVFIVGLNNGILPKDKYFPTDIEICKFIVALARTIKKCYLISNYRFGKKIEGSYSIFIDWIGKEKIEIENVNKEYWKNK